MKDDPRSRGFNYGTGWGSEPKPPIYQEAMKLSFKLNQDAQTASQKAWALDHALWRVRIATTRTEKAAAIHDLTEYIRTINEPQAAHIPPPHLWSDA